MIHHLKEDPYQQTTQKNKEKTIKENKLETRIACDNSKKTINH